MKNLRFAMKQVMPTVPSVFFVGLAFGILLEAAGYPVIWSFLSAVFVYAGSMQIVMVSLLKAGAPLYMMAMMALFINARHIFYGIGLVEKYRRQGWKWPYLAMTLTDETYSVLCSMQCPEDVDEDTVILEISILGHLIWICGCTFGALLGQSIPFDMAGIDFSATAFFTAVVVNQWRQFGSHIPAITGLAGALAFYLLLGPNRFILPALAVSLLALAAMKGPLLKRMGGAPHAG